MITSTPRYRTYALTILLALLTSVGTRLAQQPPRIVSPEVLPDGRVTFRLNAPKADEVILTGEFLDGPRSFARDADGVWSVMVGPIEPEIYHYNFTIDGVRTIDPANPQLKTGSTPSTITSVLEIRASIAGLLRCAAVPHGEIRTHWYHSKSLGTSGGSPFTRRLVTTRTKRRDIPFCISSTAPTPTKTPGIAWAGPI